jgi:hypothetical protein
MSYDGEPIVLVASDRLPRLLVQFKDNNTGIPVDCSSPDITAKARFRERNAAETLLEIDLTKSNSGYDGVFLLDWPADALGVDPGRYEVQASLLVDALPHTAWANVRLNIKERFAEPV